MTATTGSTAATATTRSTAEKATTRWKVERATIGCSAATEDDVILFYSGTQIDTVYDFEDGADLIDLSNVVGYGSFEDLTVQNDDGNAVI